MLRSSLLFSFVALLMLIKMASFSKDESSTEDIIFTHDEFVFSNQLTDLNIKIPDLGPGRYVFTISTDAGIVNPEIFLQGQVLYKVYRGLYFSSYRVEKKPFSLVLIRSTTIVYQNAITVGTGVASLKITIKMPRVDRSSPWNAKLAHFNIHIEEKL